MCYFSGSFDASAQKYNFTEISQSGTKSTNIFKALLCALIYVLLFHQVFANYFFGMYFASSVGYNWMNERVKASIGLQTLTGKLSISEQNSYRFV